MSLTRRGRIVTALGVIAGFFGLLVLGGYLYLRSIGVYGSSDPGPLVSVVIPKGAGAAEVGEVLAEKDVIPSALGFRITVYLEGGAEDIKAGTYELRTGLVAHDALAALLETEPAGEDFVTVTFQEGLWLTEFAERLDEATELSGDRFLRLTTRGRVRSSLLPDGIDTLEGLLFPSTYQIIERDTVRDVVDRLVDEMEEQVAALEVRGPEARSLTPYELVIVASMIEAETRVDEERGMVARVIYNRLEQGIPLGIDATFLYALGERKDVLTPEDLAIDSPYNLRQHAGLPPTPIGAPGTASLEAAARPTAGEWLYYVLADCEGNHAFSETNEEFLEDKAAYQALDC